VLIHTPLIDPIDVYGQGFEHVVERAGGRTECPVLVDHRDTASGIKPRYANGGLRRHEPFVEIDRKDIQHTVKLPGHHVELGGLRRSDGHCPFRWRAQNEWCEPSDLLIDVRACH